MCIPFSLFNFMRNTNELVPKNEKPEPKNNAMPNPGMGGGMDY